MIRLAKFSDCGKYRYWLLRAWDESKPTAMCIGLNPSKANGEKDDNTISILIRHLGSLGYGSFYMLNLYAMISPHPEDLSSTPYPVGEDNDYHIENTANQSDAVIFCWGRFPQATWRAKKIKQRFPGAVCFGKNQDGSPWHPRWLHYAKIKPEGTKLIKF